MMGAVKSVFSKYADFSGRARRSEYWYFTLFNLLVTFVLALIGFLIGGTAGQLVSGLSSVYSLAVLIPGLAVCWRRLHDIGKSGAYYFMGLIPLVGVVLLIIWFCQDSMPGNNEYGSSPKEQGNSRTYSGFNVQGEYVFLYCPQCRSNLRFPRGSGNAMVRCPQCGNVFNVNT